MERKGELVSTREQPTSRNIIAEYPIDASARALIFEFSPTQKLLRPAIEGGKKPGTESDTKQFTYQTDEEIIAAMHAGRSISWPTVSGEAVYGLVKRVADAEGIPASFVWEKEMGKRRDFFGDKNLKGLQNYLYKQAKEMDIDALTILHNLMGIRFTLPDVITVLGLPDKRIYRWDQFPGEIFAGVLEEAAGGLNIDNSKLTSELLKSTSFAFINGQTLRPLADYAEKKRDKHTRETGIHYLRRIAGLIDEKSTSPRPNRIFAGGECVTVYKSASTLANEFGHTEKYLKKILTENEVPTLPAQSPNGKVFDLSSEWDAKNLVTSINIERQKREAIRESKHSPLDPALWASTQYYLDVYRLPLSTARDILIDVRKTKFGYSNYYRRDQATQAFREYFSNKRTDGIYFREGEERVTLHYIHRETGMHYDTLRKKIGAMGSKDDETGLTLYSLPEVMRELGIVDVTLSESIDETT